MNSRPRFAAFSLLLFLTACFLCLSLWAIDERTAAGPLGESLAAQNSAGLPQAAQPAQAAGRKSPANKTGPLFVVIQNGKVRLHRQDRQDGHPATALLSAIMSRVRLASRRSGTGIE